MMKGKLVGQPRGTRVNKQVFRKELIKIIFKIRGYGGINQQTLLPSFLSMLI